MKPTILRLLCLALPLFFLSHVPAQGATNSSCSAESMLKETLDCIYEKQLDRSGDCLSRIGTTLENSYQCTGRNANKTV
uniref:Uncharacterized protein n=1 Tax=Anguilla anguilla TaxID=7936 RepID=A0A0E9SQ15_ANGAN